MQDATGRELKGNECYAVLLTDCSFEVCRFKVARLHGERTELMDDSRVGIWWPSDAVHPTLRAALASIPEVRVLLKDEA